MKLKYTFETIEMDGQVMAVPVGDGAEDLHAMLRLNDSAAFILSCLKEETTEEALFDKMLAEYEGDAEEIKACVREFVGTLKENKLLCD